MLPEQKRQAPPLPKYETVREEETDQVIAERERYTGMLDRTIRTRHRHRDAGKPSVGCGRSTPRQFRPDLRPVARSRFWSDLPAVCRSSVSRAAAPGEERGEGRRGPRVDDPTAYQAKGIVYLTPVGDSITSCACRKGRDVSRKNIDRLFINVSATIIPDRADSLEHNSWHPRNEHQLQGAGYPCVLEKARFGNLPNLREGTEISKVTVDRMDRLI